MIRECVCVRERERERERRERERDKGRTSSVCFVSALCSEQACVNWCIIDSARIHEAVRRRDSTNVE